MKLSLNPARWFRNDATYSLSDDRVLQAFLGTVSTPGVRVSRNTVLRSVAVLGCLIVRAETFSALPVDVGRVDGDTRMPDPKSPVARLLGVAPNDVLDCGEFWRWKQVTEDINGNAYARIQWAPPRFNTPVAVWPLTAQAPAMNIVDGAVMYSYTGDAFTPAGLYPAKDILHFRGPILRSSGFTGAAPLLDDGPWVGSSLVDLASETIGQTIASETFFGSMLDNGMHFPGYAETDQKLNQEDVDRLADRFRRFSGVLQAGSVRIFDRGLKFKQSPISIKDADLTAQMRWQLEQVCRVFRVPLQMVQDMTHGNYNTSEQVDLWLAKHTIAPICVNSERTVRSRMFPSDPSAYLKFNMTALLRGDFATRASGEAALVGAGILTRNEARALEDRNPLPGLDRATLPLNIAVLDEDGDVAATTTPPSETAVARMMDPIVADARRAIAKRMRIDRERGHPVEDTISFAARRLEPIADAYAALDLYFDADTLVREVLGDADTTLVLQEV